MLRDLSSTSTAIIACIALLAIYLSPRSKPDIYHQTAMPTLDYDIVVIGAGLAGLSAVLEAGRTQTDVKICLIEKQDRLGGNSAKASSGINSITSQLDLKDFVHDTIVSGHDRSNQSLVRVLVNNSDSAIKFLEAENIDLSIRSQLGGHSQARTRRNRTGPNVGFAIISALQTAVQKLENVKILISAHVVNIGSENGHITILYEDVNHQPQRIRSRSLILTTGGFAANPTLMAQYRPDVANFPTTNGPWANGDGIQLAVAGFGASLVDMEQIQIHPTGFVDPADRENRVKILAPEALRGSGGILVNENGRRFINELTTRDIVSSAVLSETGSHAFIILDQMAAQAFGFGTLQFYMKRGLVAKCTSTTEIAAFISKSGNASISTLEDTILKYRDATAHKSDQFGKTVFPSDFQGSEYFVAEIVPVLHYCMGGLKFDVNANVLDLNNKPIPGLYAAGEVTGGLHGANRLAGNSLLECVVFGRIAATSAIAFIQKSCKSSSNL